MTDLGIRVQSPGVGFRGLDVENFRVLRRRASSPIKSQLLNLGVPGVLRTRILLFGVSLQAFSISESPIYLRVSENRGPNTAP